MIYATGDTGPISLAADLVGAIASAVAADGGSTGRLQALLDSYAPAIERTTGHADPDVEVLLFADPDRRPFPRLVNRVSSGPRFEEMGRRSVEEARRGVDRMAPLRGRLFGPTQRRDGVRVHHWSVDFADERCWQDVMPRVGGGPAWVDVVSAGVRCSDHHLACLTLLRREEHPSFRPEAADLAAVLARAAVPLIDFGLFALRREEDDDDSTLRRLLTEVAAAAELDDLAASAQETAGRPAVRGTALAALELLLTGRSEKQIAKELGRSVHTVHDAVKRVYRALGVSSRGELMALFVDRRALRAVAAVRDESEAVAAEGAEGDELQNGLHNGHCNGRYNSRSNGLLTAAS